MLVLLKGYRENVVTFIGGLCEGKYYWFSAFFSTDLKSVESLVADFTYLLSKVNWFINKVINIMSRLIYCVIFTLLHTTFRRHYNKKRI